MADDATQKYRGKVLVVDDAIDLSDMIGIVLRRSGYETGTAADGRKAASMLDDGYGLVVSDYNFPHRDEFLEELGKQKPLIILTGTPPDLESQRRLREQNDLRYMLVKPCSITELVKLVEEAYPKTA